MLHLAPSRDVDNAAAGEDVLNSRTCREEPSTQSETQSEVQGPVDTSRCQRKISSPDTRPCAPHTVELLRRARATELHSLRRDDLRLVIEQSNATGLPQRSCGRCEHPYACTDQPHKKRRSTSPQVSTQAKALQSERPWSFFGFDLCMFKWSIFSLFVMILEYIAF
jgi:hypothetical protein